MAATAMALAGIASSAHARNNPVDLVSNPNRMSYENVTMELPDYAPPFQREGVVREPVEFVKLVPGLTAEAVVAQLGEPVSKTQGKKGGEWDYNITFRMPASGHYVVCQYQLVFNEQNVVTDTVWRRRQCLDIVNLAAVDSPAGAAAIATVSEQ